VEEVVSGLLAFVADAEVIDDEGEEDGQGLVLEEASGVGTLSVAMGGEVCDEFLLGEVTRLG
jgi:hypothetical protein